ncbi:MAG TPA: methylmalonyl-CoA mutase family protein [Chloroflexota bacterium]|nr:methylmalonyl-CoA mutase family protein [Chloroflexota bacterium]
MAARESDRTRTASGIPVKELYGPTDVAASPSPPGQFPYTRGIHARMYRERLWTMRQYAGFASAADTNARFKLLLSGGVTGLSVAFDLPTQLGYDSDDPRALGEVGRVGVAIDTLDDMVALFDGIPLDRVSTSMTINATAALLLLLYELAAERQGVAPERLRGTIQNDILKEYVARGTYIFPPRPSMRLVTDTFAYCASRIPNWNTISISGYHIREAGSTAVQELAFTVANAIAYIEAALAAGLRIEQFARRLSFFFNAHNDFFEEIAKFRAARRLWASVIRDRFSCDDAVAQALRFHTQTAGSTLTAQQPLNNVVRVALQALAAVLGGTQSLHTNGYDEALALPTEQAATLALRTQQVLAFESGVTATADPLGGSYYVEWLTDELERRARALLADVDARGGAVRAIETGFMQEAIEESAYADQHALQSGARLVVGVNAFRQEAGTVPPIHSIDPAAHDRQVAALQRVRAARDGAAVEAALAAVRRCAQGSDNLLYPLREALAARASIGEICGVLREEWGEYGGS